MNRRQTESRILFFLGLILFLLFLIVCHRTADRLTDFIALASVIMLLPARHSFFNNPLLSEIQYLPEELHNTFKEVISGDFNNAYDYIDKEVIPDNILIRLYEILQTDLTVRRIKNRMSLEFYPYPLELIKWIRILPTAGKADMLPETRINKYQPAGKKETIRIGELLINV